MALCVEIGSVGSENQGSPSGFRAEIETGIRAEITNQHQTPTDIDSEERTELYGIRTQVIKSINE